MFIAVIIQCPTIFVWFVLSRKIVLPLSQEDPSIRKIQLALMTSAILK